jgi:hypothetical protein
MQNRVRSNFENSFTVEVKHKHPFAKVPNFILCNPDLSLKAKGLCSYILSKPRHWVFKIANVLQEIKEGLEAFNNAVKELLENGIMTKITTRDGAGRFKGTIYKIDLDSDETLPQTEKPSVETPYTDNPIMANPSAGKPSTGNHPLYISNTYNSNTENNNTNIIKNKQKENFENTELEVVKKKQEDLPQDFIDFYEAYEKKECKTHQVQVQKTYKKWKEAVNKQKFNNNDDKLKFQKFLIFKAKQYMQDRDPRGEFTKQIDNWLRDGFYEKEYYKSAKTETEVQQDLREARFRQQEQTLVEMTDEEARKVMEDLATGK